MKTSALMLRRWATLTLCQALILTSAGPQAYAAAGRALDGAGTHADVNHTVAVWPVALRLRSPISGSPLSIPAGLAVKTAPLGVIPGGAAAHQAAAANGLAPMAPAAGLAPAALNVVPGLAAARPLERSPLAASVSLDLPAPQNAGADFAAEAYAPPAGHAAPAAGKEVTALDAPGRANAGRVARSLESLRRTFLNRAHAADAAPARGEDAVTLEQGATARSAPAHLAANPAQGPPAAGPAATEKPEAAKAEAGKTEAGTTSPAPAPSAPDGGGSAASSAKAAWRNGNIFMVGLLVAQFGVEAWSASWAKWVQTSYGMDQYSMLTMIGMVTTLVAGYAGGWAADKFGLKKSFVASSVLVAATAAATLLLYNAGILAFAPLVALVVLRLFMNSAGTTAQQTLPIAIFKDNKDALQKYNSVSQFVLEIAGIGVPYSIGALLGWFGSVGTMWILPITLVASAVLIAAFMRVSEDKQKKTVTVLAQAQKEADPKLLTIGRLGYPAVVLLNYLLYSVLAIGYGNFLHPGGSPLEQAAAAGVAGKIVSLYSAGGLLAALWLSGLPQAAWNWLKAKWPWLNRRADAFAARFSKAPAAQPVDEQTASLRSTAKWMAIGAAGLLGFLPMLWSSPFWAAAAMIPFGFTNVMSSLQLLSMVQANAPQEKKGKVMGGLRTVATLVATAAFFGFSQLFKHYPTGLMPFYVLLGLNAALGAYYIWVSLKLKRYVNSGK